MNNLIHVHSYVLGETLMKMLIHLDDLVNILCVVMNFCHQLCNNNVFVCRNAKFENDCVTILQFRHLSNRQQIYHIQYYSFTKIEFVSANSLHWIYVLFISHTSWSLNIILSSNEAPKLQNSVNCLNAAT